MKKDEEEKEKQRTLRQNRAMHKYFRLLADELNDAGLDMRAVLKPHIEIPWSEYMVKEHLWRPIQTLQLGKKSSTELTTAEVDKIFDTVNRALSEHGIHVPFPSIDSLIQSPYENTKTLQNEK